MNEDFRSGLDEDLAAELRRIAAETGNSEEQVLCMALFFLRRQLGEAREQLDHERADADLRAALDAERAKVAALAAALEPFAEFAVVLRSDGDRPELCFVSTSLAPDGRQIELTVHMFQNAVAVLADIDGAAGRARAAEKIAEQAASLSAEYYGPSVWTPDPEPDEVTADGEPVGLGTVAWKIINYWLPIWRGGER